MTQRSCSHCGSPDSIYPEHRHGFIDPVHVCNHCDWWGTDPAKIDRPPESGEHRKDR